MISGSFKRSYMKDERWDILGSLLTVMLNNLYEDGILTKKPKKVLCYHVEETDKVQLDIEFKEEG